MQRTVVTLGCALGLLAGSAFAQQQQSSGESLTDKARQAAQAVGEKSKETAGKVMDKVEQSAQGSQSSQAGESSQQTKTMGASGSSGGANDPQQMQKQADADLKSAKAQCETKQGQQKTLCEKEAALSHAQAEVAVEKAKTMGAGSSTQSK